MTQDGSCAFRRSAMNAAGVGFPSRKELRMGDKSPKSKQRDKSQKDAAKAQAKSDQAKRQAGFASEASKDKIKK
jgi:hypothetical protein